VQPSDFLDALEEQEARVALKGVSLLTLDLCRQKFLVFELPDGKALQVVQVSDEIRAAYAQMAPRCWQNSLLLEPGKADSPAIGLRFFWYLICNQAEVRYLQTELNWWKSRRIWKPGDR